MKNFGVIIADEYEFDPFIELCRKYNGVVSDERGHRVAEFKIGEKNVKGIECGIGKVNAASAAAFMIANDKPDIILNAGLSGAISGLAKDDIIVGESFVECDFDLTAIGYAPGAKPQETYIYETPQSLIDLAEKAGVAKAGKFGCGDIFLADKAKKNFFKETFGICEFDMETAAVASVCHESGVPYLSIRQISDTADDTSPEDYTNTNNMKKADLTHVLEQIILLAE